MIDYDIYNERRRQLIELFESDMLTFLEILNTTIVDLVDTLEWEDNHELAGEMGWTISVED